MGIGFLHICSSVQDKKFIQKEDFLVPGPFCHLFQTVESGHRFMDIINLIYLTYGNFNQPVFS